MAASILRIGATVAKALPSLGGGFLGGLKNIVGEFGKAIITGLGFSAGDKILNTGLDAATAGINKLKEKKENVSKVSQKNTSRNRRVNHEYTEDVENHLPKGVKKYVGNEKYKKSYEPEEEEDDQDSEDNE